MLIFIFESRSGTSASAKGVRYIEIVLAAFFVIVIQIEVKLTSIRMTFLSHRL